MSAASASDEVLTMQCVLCDQKADEQHGLVFRLRESGESRAHTPTNEVRAELGQFGVCNDCFSRYQGRRRRIALEINKMLRWNARSASINSQ